MSLPEVGDLAMIVHTHGCSGSGDELGQIHLVIKIDPVSGTCANCGGRYVGPGVRFDGDGPGEFYPRAWTRRIDPLHELERIPERAEA